MIISRLYMTCRYIRGVCGCLSGVIVVCLGWEWVCEDDSMGNGGGVCVGMEGNVCVCVYPEIPYTFFFPLHF